MEEIKSEVAIAIVGMSCRFPGASNPDEFWKVISSELDVISEIPASRINIKDYYDEDLEAEGKTNQRHGAYLENIHHFDPFFFNVSPKEAMEMHPSQKLMLELAWEAIERSQIPYKNILGSKAGVYIGNIWNDFEHFRKERGAIINSFSAIGQSANIIASRVSYFLGLRGPSFVVDTGCSSSMVALALGIQGLREKTMDVCFAGGINHILNPEQYVYLGKFGGLSSKGRCSAFDAEADGFVRAEGAGLIILKRLSDAIRDNDRIHAVIRGYSMNNNGFNENLPATSFKGQMELFQEAYRDAGIKYKDVHYIETHGTGTKVGDPNEVIALGELFGKDRQPGHELRIGSVKTNFGHTEAAAGMAGILKVVLSIQHKMLPKNLHFSNPNPKINFNDYNVRVQDATTGWPVLNGETLKAGVSSFGWGGTNVHVILEEYRDVNEVPQVKDLQKQRYVLPISARSEKSLVNYVKEYGIFLNQKENANDTWLYNICKSSALLRPHFEYRTLLTGKNIEELRASATEMLNKEAFEPVKISSNDKTVFIFPGQGSQWLGMGCELYQEENTFREAIDECDAAFRKYTNWSLVEELFANSENSQLKYINIIQPAICAVQIALARLWMSWGIIPDAVVGHSMGEVAAANIAGILSVDDAARIICTRSKLMSRLSGSGGAMALTELSLEEAQKTVDQYQGKICIAVQNSPKSTVFAGDKASIDHLLADLEAKSLFCRLVKVDVASHSPQMDPIKEDLREALQTISPMNAWCTFYSTVKAKQMQGSEMSADYWVDNLRNAVQFSAVTKMLAENGHSFFIEVSPHPVLTNSINENLSQFNKDFGVISSTHREKPELYEFYNNLNLSYTYGINPQWEKAYGLLPAEYVNLPGYPFNRENYELEQRVTNSNAEKPDFHPLLGNAVPLAGIENVYYWTNTLTLESLPFLQGHRVNGIAVFPASAYIEMAKTASERVFQSKDIVLKDVIFHKAVSFSSKTPVYLQFKLERVDESSAMFILYSRTADETNKELWEINCSGEACIDCNPSKVLHLPENIAEEKQTAQNFYQQFRKISVEYDELFRNVKILKASSQNAVTHIKLNHQAQKLGKKYQVNPVLADNFIQTLFATYFSNRNFETQKSAFVSSIEKVTNFHEIENTDDFIVFAEIINKKESGHIENFAALIEVFSKKSSQLVLRMENVMAKIIDLGIPCSDKTDDADSSDWFAQMLAADELDRKSIIQSKIIEKVAKLIKANESKINPGMTLKGLGVDSILAVQLRNILEKEFRVKFAVADLWKYPSIKSFSLFIDILIYNNIDELRSSCNSTITRSKDIVVLSQHPNAPMRLICFHDAGGSISLFDEWDKLLGDQFEIVCVQLPGRGDRSDEMPYQKFEQFVNEYIAKLHQATENKPFVLYGHSMGGLLAFETARRLENEYKQIPEALIISGTPSLNGYVNTFVNGIIESNYTDEQLVKLLPSADKIDLSNEYHARLVRTLRADFELIHSYRYNQGPKLATRVVALSATQDDRVTFLDVMKWQGETSNNFRLEVRSGGHNFVYQDGAYITSLIKEVSTGQQVEKKISATNNKQNDSKK